MKNKIFRVLCVLFGLMMVNSGLNKFFNYMPMPEMSEEMMQVIVAFVTIKWIFSLVGIVEIVGGILVCTPKTRALGAIIILPVMVGIVLHHAVHDVAGITTGLVLFAINIWIIALDWDKYSSIFK